jgi:hypothetical protein
VPRLVAVGQLVAPAKTDAEHNVVAPEVKLTVPEASPGSPTASRVTESPCGVVLGREDADIK